VRLALCGSLTDEGKDGDGVIHVASRDWEYRREEEEDGSEQSKRQTGLSISERSLPSTKL
jgi:hypothetical protein